MVLQAVGAIIASIALTNNKSLQTGDDFIIAGLASQVFTLFVFMALCADFGIRVLRRRRRLGDDVALVQDPQMEHIRNSWQFHAFLIALALSAVLVFWRSVYRVVELNQGFFGPVTFKQYLFVGFEGVLMLILVSALAIFHPAICLGEAMNSERSEKLRKDGEANRETELVAENRNITIKPGDTRATEGKVDEEAHSGKPEPPETSQPDEVATPSMG
jgi:hypothetical protein